MAANGATSKCFSFPLLDKKEICRRLVEFGAPKLSQESLLAPSADILLPVYQHLASVPAMYGPRETSMQPGFEAIQVLGDYPEMYSESYVLLKAYTRLRKFMAAAGVEDFSILNDVFRPESQRTIRNLSAAINFVMYSNHKVKLVTDLRAKRDEEIAKLEEIREEKLKIQTEIAQIEQARVAEQPRVDELELEMKELNSYLQAMNKQQLGLQLDINNLKQELVSLQDKISSVEFEIMQKLQVGACIRAQLVENPQELQHKLQEKKAALAEEEMRGKSALESRERWHAKVEVITKAEKKIAKLQRMLQSLEEEQVNERNIDKVLKERKARLRAIEKEEWALDAKKEELEWGAKRLEEQSEKYKQHYEAASKELEAMKAKQERWKIEREARIHAVSEQNNQTEALCRMGLDLIAQKDKRMAELEAAKNELVDVVTKFTETVAMRQDTKLAENHALKMQKEIEEPDNTTF